VRTSTTEHSDPKENAIERVNGILKSEFLNYQSFKSIEQVERAVSKAIDFYNNRQPHRSLNMLTPREATDHSGMIPQTMDQLQR
jgi:transposase InsO family protein